MAKEKPVEVRLGSIKAAIWRNETDNGSRYNITLSKLYKSDSEWKSTQHLGRDDLLVAAKVLDLAHTKIFSFAQAEKSDS